MRLTNTILNEKGKIQLNIRAYDRENKEWVEDLELMLDWSNYETMDIMHGTRKIDKSGVEVYEGDIIEFDYKHPSGQVERLNGVVDFLEFMFVVVTSEFQHYPFSRIQNVNIINNIYDGIEGN